MSSVIFDGSAGDLFVWSSLETFIMVSFQASFFMVSSWNYKKKSSDVLPQYNITPCRIKWQRDHLLISLHTIDGQLTVGGGGPYGSGEADGGEHKDGCRKTQSSSTDIFPSKKRKDRIANVFQIIISHIKFVDYLYEKRDQKIRMKTPLSYWNGGEQPWSAPYPHADHWMGIMVPDPRSITARWIAGLLFGENITTYLMGQSCPKKRLMLWMSYSRRAYGRCERAFAGSSFLYLPLSLHPTNRRPERGR